MNKEMNHEIMNRRMSEKWRKVAKALKKSLRAMMRTHAKGCNTNKCKVCYAATDAWIEFDRATNLQRLYKYQAERQEILSRPRGSDDPF